MLGDMQKAIYNYFQDENPEKFNEEVIYMRRREKENLKEHFDDFFNSIKLEGIKYLGCETITDESQLPLPPVNDINESRLDLINAHFELSAEGETKKINLPLYFPKLIDDFFFYLNGNRYFAVYQLTDRNFYTRRNSLFLKTLLMPLGIYYRHFKFTTVSGIEYTSCEYLLSFYNLKPSSNMSNLRNTLFYFFIKFGLSATIDMIFNQEETMVILEEKEKPSTFEGMDTVTIRKELHIHFKTKDELRPEYLNLIGTLVAALSGNRRANIHDAVYWKKKILKTATTKIEKADNAIISLERVLDERTKRNLREVPSEMSNDIYNVIRWMLYNFYDLNNIDTVNVYNRRLRLYEYMFFPLLKKVSDASYRILNSRTKTMKRLEGVFSNIGPMFIIKRLVNNELFRFSNATSTLELFTSVLKWSARGDQALGSSSSSIAVQFRAVHPSYVGNLSLNAASASDPGMSGTITPMAKDISDFFFENKEEPEKYTHTMLDTFNR